MTRAVICGTVFEAAVTVLGLEAVGERPEVVLVDLADADAVARAAGMPGDVPRVAVGRPEQERLLRAAGCALAVAPSAEPAAIGPLVRAALPAPSRGRTRLVVVTGSQGGTGRTLLVAGLAERLATRVAVLVVDATGSGMAGWWLRCLPGPWSDLEGLVDELTTEHLGIVAAERDRLRVIGGAPEMPSAALVAAVTRESIGLADIVIVDAPTLFDERARALTDAADRVLLVAAEDPAAVGAVGASLDERRTWLIASRSRAERLGPHPVVRALPDDPAAVGSARRGPAPVGGPLGRAYDDLAELLALEVA
jgi:hypothetical protein